MESITTFFKEENDVFFCRGYRKGFEEGYAKGFDEGYLKGLEEVRNELLKEGREEVISKFIEKLGLSDEQAASIVRVPLELVQKIRKKLQK